MANKGLALDKAYLTAIWLEGIFYGVNLMTFFSYLFIAKYKRAQRRIQPILFSIAILMFLISTTHVSMGFQRLIEGFITRRDATGGPAVFFSNVSIPANVAKVTLHTINVILGDGILVWRCYHVYGKSLPASILPMLLLTGTFACMIGQCYTFANAQAIHSAFVAQLARWNGSVFSMSLATNVVTTTLIAVRIWWIGRQIDDALIRSATKYRRVLALIIESGVVYSSAVVIEITLYFLGSNGFYIVYDPIAQLASIVPTMIIMMTTLGMSSNDLKTQYTRPTTTTRGGRNAGGVMLESRPHFAVRGQISTFGTGFDEESMSLELKPGKFSG